MSLRSQLVNDRLNTASSVYITRDSTAFESSRASTYTPRSFKMPSLKLSTSRSEPNSPERTATSPSSPLSSRLHSFARYNLWPRSKKQKPLGPISSQTAPPTVLPVRSPTSMSDHLVSSPTRTSKVPSRGNLALRRKISVPELREKPPVECFDTESSMGDSPTIPGRPPLRSISSQMYLGERQRSQSLAPDSEFLPLPSDHIASLIFSPSRPPPPIPQAPESPVISPVPAWPLPNITPTWSVYNNSSTYSSSSTYNPTRPLSPILSPVLSPADTPVPGSPVIDTTPAPQVPPKPVFNLPSLPAIPPAPPKKETLRTRPSLPILRPDTYNPANTPSTPAPAQEATPTTPVHRRNRSHSPKLGPCPIEESTPSDETTPAKALTKEDLATIMDRGRPIVRKKSIKSIFAAASPPLDMPDLPKSLEAQLPTGMRPQEASLMLPVYEREGLAKQAVAQAERFEVLPTAQVGTLSKELRQLDERCEYLRKTYRSLRQGRQKLHARLLSYLKSETLTFSRERLLKQEEALVELDRAIDDWSNKLDIAENRRLRLRQKLLEHVAAAVMLGSNQVKSSNDYNKLTPPASREGSPQNSPGKERKEIESIKIYADDGVLCLFSELEYAIESMCEGTTI